SKTKKTMKKIYLFAIAISFIFQQSVAQNNCTPLITSGLIAYYPFCGNANAASGNGHNGTVNGATLVPDRFGNPKSAYYFDGIDDTITLNLIQQNITSYSISAWFKTIVGGPIVTGERDNITYFGKRCLTLDVNNPNGGSSYGKITYRADGPGTSIGQWTDNTYNDNSWHHVVGVFNSTPGAINPNQFKIYMDGVLASSFGSSTDTANSPISNARPMLIGSHYVWPNSVFDGTLDDIRIYDCALTDSEITVLYGSFHSGIRENELLNSFSIYPNPAKEEFNINYSLIKISDVKIEIFNIMGKKLKSFSFIEQHPGTYHHLLQEKDITASTGIYIVRLNVGNESSVQRIVMME